MSVSIPVTLAQYSVLAKTQITNSGTTIISNGNLGSPGGSSPGGITYVNGREDDSVNTTTALNQLTTTLRPLLMSMASQPSVPPTVIENENYLFSPGGYQAGSILTLETGHVMIFDGQNQTNAQFYIHANQIVLTNGTMTLINGARPENIFWISDSNIAITSPGITINGNFIAQTTITLSTGTQVNGRLYTQTSSVMLSSNTIITPTSPIHPVPCYLRGTRVLTDQGYVPVEKLTVGMMIAHRGVIVPGRHNTIRIENYTPITWLGHFRVKPKALNGTSYPICFSRGSLGKDLPITDLYVSPEHNLIIDGKMVEARHLVNGTTIFVDRRRRDVEYYHVEVKRHSALVVEGILAESYLSVNNRWVFD